MNEIHHSSAPDWRWDGVPNGYNMLLRNVDDPLSRKGDKSYFNADSGTPISEFLDEYEPLLIYLLLIYSV